VRSPSLRWVNGRGTRGPADPVTGRGRTATARGPEGHGRTAHRTTRRPRPGVPGGARSGPVPPPGGPVTARWRELDAPAATSTEDVATPGRRRSRYGTVGGQCGDAAAAAPASVPPAPRHARLVTRSGNGRGVRVPELLHRGGSREARRRRAARWGRRTRVLPGRGRVPPTAGVTAGRRAGSVGPGSRPVGAGDDVGGHLDAGPQPGGGERGRAGRVDDRGQQRSAAVGTVRASRGRTAGAGRG
jgi:hypothetical protein